MAGLLIALEPRLEDVVPVRLVRRPLHAGLALTRPPIPSQGPSKSGAGGADGGRVERLAGRRQGDGGMLAGLVLPALRSVRVLGMSINQARMWLGGVRVVNRPCARW